MRRENEVRLDVLSRSGRYEKVRPEGASKRSPSPLKVKYGLRGAVILSASTPGRPERTPRNGKPLLNP
jgi:hypothetical protein